MSTSKKKVAANRINAQKSPGPTNTASTRFNATKHGLLAVGITELDNAEGYRNILSDLMREKSPVGAIETFLVESAAIEMVRWLRARRFEAECITGELNPPTHSPGLHDLLGPDGGEVLDPGLPAAISAEAAQKLVTFQRYESTFANRFFRILHELERWQRMRQGELLPAPLAADISLHAGTGAMDSVNDHTKIIGVVANTRKSDSVPPIPEAAENPSGELERLQRMRTGERLPAPAVVDVSVHGETGTVDLAHGDTEIVKLVSTSTDTVDSVPAALEQPRVLLGDED
ncbi:MAG TPA: hypothetical protein VN310_03975 [Candidatus Dormibacteraeota bacterium]|jgi:hypothetical protein|nr:hypothetical protein [Candidatus Dormibacteraeota bacterium]